MIPVFSQVQLHAATRDHHLLHHHQHRHLLVLLLLAFLLPRPHHRHQCLFVSHPLGLLFAIMTIHPPRPRLRLRSPVHPSYPLPPLLPVLLRLPLLFVHPLPLRPSRFLFLCPLLLPLLRFGSAVKSHRPVPVTTTTAACHNRVALCPLSIFAMLCLLLDLSGSSFPSLCLLPVSPSVPPFLLHLLSSTLAMKVCPFSSSPSSDLPGSMQMLSLPCFHFVFGCFVFLFFPCRDHSFLLPLSF